MGRIARGIRVTRRSAGLLAERPELFALPALSTASVLVSLGALVAVGLATGLVHLPAPTAEGLARLTDVSGPVEFAGLFVAILVSTGVATFFNAALVHCAHRALRGEHPTVREGLAAAWAVKRYVLLYALATATIGVVVRLLDEHLHVGGRLAAWAFDLGWSVLTFFVVPVMVLETDVDGRSMFEHSGTAVTETWGESLTASFGIGLVGLLVVAPVIVLAGVGALAVGHVWTFAGLALVACVAVGTVTSALGYVVRTDLYLYARDGEDAPSLGLDRDALLEET